MVDNSNGVIVSGRTYPSPRALPQLASFAGVESARSGFPLADNAPRMTGPVRLRPVVPHVGGTPVVRIPGSVPGGLTV